MNRSAKTIVLVVLVSLVAGGAFWGGMLFQSSKAPVAFAGGGARGAGGPMANMTEEEQAEFQSMTEEERQAWFEENGGAMGAGNGGPTRGGNLEGEVIEYADGMLTLSVGDSGSQTVYVDEDTVIAYAEDAGELAVGATVMVIATPAADSVTTASLVVVK